MKSGIIILLILLTHHFSFGQSIEVNSNYTVSDLVSNVLLENQQVMNLTVNGVLTNSWDNYSNITYFEQGTSNFNFDNGLLLTTGEGIKAKGPNSVLNSTSQGSLTSYLNDLDVKQISGGTITTGVIIEFDVVAQGSELSFEYIFGSEEYSNYVCSKYNDVFGIIISGQNINGTLTNSGKNIALIPDPMNTANYTNTAVATNTVNGGVPGLFSGSNPAECNLIDPNWLQYSVFYTSNQINDPAIQFNGYTVPLTAKTEVVCGELYHLKIFISNVSDISLDSGVFLKNMKFTKKPNPLFTLNPNEGYSPLLIEIQNNSQNLDSLFWNFGNGEEFSTDIVQNYTEIYDTTYGTYQVTLIGKQGLCVDTLIQECTILQPEIEIESANVFTPNNDGVNDTWKFKHLVSTEKIELTILNRWGTEVYKEVSLNPEWNGRDFNNNPLSEGVYFYSYSTKSPVNNSKITGNGFIHLQK